MIFLFIRFKKIYVKFKIIFIQTMNERIYCKDKRLEAGSSKRIWEELYKVLDASNVIIQVIDARDPLGTRCKYNFRILLINIYIKI